MRRNLARGYSAKDLNVSFLNEKKFRLQNKMDELKDRGKRVMENIGEVKDDIITKWEEKSGNFIETFLLLFGRDRLSNIWNESKGRIMQALSPPGSPSGSVNGDEEDPDLDDDDYQMLDSPPTKKRTTRTINNMNVMTTSTGMAATGGSSNHHHGAGSSSSNLYSTSSTLISPLSNPDATATSESDEDIHSH